MATLPTLDAVRAMVMQREKWGIWDAMECDRVSFERRPDDGEYACLAHAQFGVDTLANGVVCPCVAMAISEPPGSSLYYFQSA